jgi:hypothetical protein
MQVNNAGQEDLFFVQAGQVPCYFGENLRVRFVGIIKSRRINKPYVFGMAWKVAPVCGDFLCTFL